MAELFAEARRRGLDAAAQAAAATAAALQDGACVYSGRSISSGEQQTSGGADERDSDDERDTIDDDNDDNDDAGIADAVSETFPARFNSWAELEDYIDELGASTYQVFHKRSSMSVRHRHAMVEASKRKKGRAIDYARDPDFTPPEWVYYSRVYACTCGFKNHRRGQGKRTHVVIRGTGCKAKITAAVHYDAHERVHYLKTKLKGVHNHPCDRERYYSYAENRRFEPALLREMVAMDARGAKARAILDFAAQYVQRKTGMASVYKIADVRNALRRARLEQGQHPSDNATGTDVARSSAIAQDNGIPQPAAERITLDALPIATETSDSESVTASRVSAAPQSGAPIDAAVAGDQVNRDAESTASSERSRRKRSAAAMLASDARAPALPSSSNSRRLVTLAHVESLVNATYSYALARDEIARVVIAIPQHVPQTISGFTCDVTVLSPQRDRSADVAFVLPRFAVTGCEDAIARVCREQTLSPSALGVHVVVDLPSDGAKIESVLTHRQLVAMKHFHIARQRVLDVQRALEWLATAPMPSTRPPAPLDSAFDCSTDSLARSLQFLPLTRTVVRGRHGVGVETGVFTDSIVGANVVKFASSSANLDVDCVKAALLHMHSRFNAEAAIVCPDALTGVASVQMQERASAYGAFTTPKQCVLGVTQLQSTRWSAFFYDCARNKCFLFQTLEHEFAEHHARVHALLQSAGIEHATFACSASPTAVPVAVHDSGVLALLFLELFVLKLSWTQVRLTDLAYFRKRYLLQSIAVVGRQDLSELSSYA